MTGYKGIQKMSLRPEFSAWFDIITDYTYRGKIRKMFPIRSDDFFGSVDQWPAVLKRAETKLAGPESLVILECLNLLKKQVENKEYSEIIFSREQKPYYILDNIRVLYPTDRHSVIYIDLDRLIQHGYITKEQKEKEEARWKVIKTAAVYMILCAVTTALGDHFSAENLKS